MNDRLSSALISNDDPSFVEFDNYKLFALLCFKNRIRE